VKPIHVALTGGIALCVSLGLYAATGTPAAISLIKVYRTAEYLKPPSASWSPAVVGAALKGEDSLRTSNNSYADMELEPSARFRLKENSLLKIEKLASESREADGSMVRLTDLGLLKGEVIARLEKLPADARLSLRAPAAIAAVRGTGFLVSVGSDGQTTDVAVANGAVQVQAVGEPQKSVAVRPEQRTSISPWGTAMLRAKGTGVPPRELLIKRLGDPKVPLKDAAAMLERLKNPRPSLENLVIGAEGQATAPPELGDGAEAEQWARAEARRIAQRQILEKMTMVRLSGDETIGDLMARDATICRALLSLAGNPAVVNEEYLKRERRAVVRCDLPLSAVRSVIGRDIALAWKAITPIPMAEYAAVFGGFIRAATERAATVDAYRRLAQTIYGTVVNSTTTLKDMVVQNDQIEIAVKGVVQGAEEISRTYYSDGSIDVVLQASGSAVRQGVSAVAGEILGKHYMASPSVIGADEFTRLLSLNEI
jgi:hypothetical protein